MKPLSTSISERIELAKSLGWTDLREVRGFGTGLVLRGYRPFWNAGVQVSVRDDVPLNDKDIICKCCNKKVPDVNFLRKGFQ